MFRSKFLLAFSVTLLLGTSAYANADHSLPDPTLTPGAAADDVAQDNIQDTICVPGFTKPPRRPPASYTTKMKKDELADPRYGYTDTDTKSYEEDHLIPLTLGGDPRSQDNLWPQAWDAGDWGARVKDKLEVKLNKLVCAGIVPLEEAQDAISTNWIDAYKKYMPMKVPKQNEVDDPDDDQ